MTATSDQATRMLAGILLAVDQINTDLRTYAEYLAAMDSEDVAAATSRPALVFIAMAGTSLAQAEAGLGTAFMATQNDMRGVTTGFTPAGVLVRAQLVAAGTTDGQDG